MNLFNHSGKKLYLPLALFLFSGLLAACSSDSEPSEDTQIVDAISDVVTTDAPESPASQVLWPKSETVVPSDEERIQSILNAMSVEDKVGQLVMAETRSVKPSDVKKYRLGGILNGGGAYPNNNKQAKVSDWVDLADEFYQASMDRDDDAPKVPVIWGTDAVHGHNNVLGATIFPHNIGLGATGNPELMQKIGAATAKEVAATGIYWTFAPTVAVPMDDRWGRTYEGFSEDPKIVVELSSAMIEGLQGTLGDDFLSQEHILATAKHFIGDGGTANGVDQGDTRLSEADLSKLHGQGYFSAMDVGVQTVMATFNRWNGEKVHGSKYLLTDVLKTQMGFDGFVVGDWNGHGQVDGCTNSDCAASVNAGVDMIMVPEDWEAFYKNTLQQVKDGVISAERLDDAVTRILRVKLRMGLFDDAGPKSRANAGDQAVIGNAEHRAIAQQAVRESLVLLKNNNTVLPITANAKVLVAGEAAKSFSSQMGGWSLTWQGTENKNTDFPGATLVVDGIRQAVEGAGGQFAYNAEGEYAEKPDVAIMILAEPPYAEGPGDRKYLEFSPDNKKHLATMKRLQAEGIPVVTVFMSGRAMWVNPEMNASDAFVAAWLPGSEGQGIAKVLFCVTENSAECGFKGRLSFSWPRLSDQGPLNNSDSNYDPLFPVGYGLTYADTSSMEQLPEQVNASAASAIEQVLFNGRGVPPFTVSLQEQEGEVVAASNAMNQTANAGVHTEVFDRKLQEDAQRISFNGAGLHSWQLNSAEALDWTSKASQGAVLGFEMNVLKESDEAVFAAMHCGVDCSGAQDITSKLRGKFSQGWQSVYLDLSCFEKLGTDLSGISHPLVLETSGAWSVELSNVHLAEKNAESQTLGCEP